MAGELCRSLGPHLWRLASLLCTRSLRSQGLSVAIKKQRAGNNGRFSETALRAITQTVRREVRALARVRHPNVVRLHGACVEPAPCLVMAFAAGGGLDQAVREGRFASVPDVIKLLAGIARGMEAVHAHKVIHLDLKPENVLLSADNVPWVTDFGLSTSTNLASMSASSVGGRGTLYYKVHAFPPVPQIRRKRTEQFSVRVRRRLSSSPSPPSSPPQPMSTRTPSLHGSFARASNLIATCSRLRRQWLRCCCRASGPSCQTAAIGATRPPLAWQSLSRRAG